MTKGKKNKRPLTSKQRKMVKGLLKGKTIEAAALDAGYSKQAPRQTGFNSLQSIKEKMPELMDRIGMTDEALLTKYLQPGLDATETKASVFEGGFVYSKPLVAWGPRLNALDIAFNLKGSYAPKFDPKNLPLMPIQIITNVNFPNPHE